MENDSSANTPTQLRRFHLKRRGQPRMIDHGSNDWSGVDVAGGGNDVIRGDRADGNGSSTSSSANDSPGEGLHRRHYQSDRNGQQGNDNHCHSSIYPLQHSHQFHNSSGTSVNKTHVVSASQSKQRHHGVAGKSFSVKNILQFSLLFFILAYMTFLYVYNAYQRSRVINTLPLADEQYDEIQRLLELRDNQIEETGSNANYFGERYASRNMISVGKRTNSIITKYQRNSPLQQSYDSNHNRSHHDNNSSGQMLFSSSYVPYSYNSNTQLKSYFEIQDSSITLERTAHWARHQLQSTIIARKKRRKERVLLTRPPLSDYSAFTDYDSLMSGNVEGVTKTHAGSVPLWYTLNHLTPETLLAIHNRWKKQTKGESPAMSYDSQFSLCGYHAKEAARHYPQNYFPSATSSGQNEDGHEPLGPLSRVLISGILSPLGMNLAIALNRQCNVTSFLGLDTEIPNDPLSRLEQQERLAVLMEELNDLKQLQIPFLGLEGKRGRKGPMHEKEAKIRDTRLVGIYKNYKQFKHRSTSSSVEDELIDAVNTPYDYALPYEKFGIPLSPGIHPSGSGPLEIILEYRPTHIVHLAGTQSDSLLSTKNANDPTQIPALQSKDEEDEAILKESISSRPHLYEMRMGATGMEQVLSAIVAQTVLPPRTRRHLSKSDLDKMKKPHFVYASSYDAHYFGSAATRINVKTVERDIGGIDEYEDDSGENLGDISNPKLLQSAPRGLHGVSRLIDEILSSTYYALHGVSSIGLRFDAIYGPRGFGVPSTNIPIYNVRRIRRRGGVSADVDLAETAVRRLYVEWMKMVKQKRSKEKPVSGIEDKESALKRLSLIQEAGWLHAAHDPRDFVFVEDAVSAIIVAMQYRTVENSPTTFNIGSGEMSTLAALSEEIELLSTPDGKDVKMKHDLTKSVIDVEQSSAAQSASLDSNEYLRWSAVTTMPNGTAKLLSWHIDRALSFFPNDPSDDHAPLDGESVLSRRDMKSCSIRDDPTCLREAHTAYPCASECSTKSCSPSVFDSVIPLVHELTEDCETVLFTMSLGYNVKTLALQTQYSDGQEQLKNLEPTLCTIAFVPSESELVENIIGKVPPSSLSKMDLSEDSNYETKLKKLSGHLVHQGWVLIFVNGAAQPLTAEEKFLPKLSPRLLFHPSVVKVMFVDETFSSTPLPEDAQFLSSQMSRGKLKKRTVMGLDEKGKRTKYKLPEEPPRTAVLMVAPMRHMPVAEGSRISLKEVTENLMKEIGNANDHESKEDRVQREFYERARSFINSFDLRSLGEVSRHKIEIKDFIRSRWLVHNLKQEEGHQLRCEWYREHVRWNTSLDQLSFAYVMAKRELTRKVITEQPLQTEAEKVSVLQMIINAKSDAKEWHPIFSGEGERLPVHHSQISPEAIPQNLEDQPDNDINEVVPELPGNDEASTFYVRIMSDERMLEARTIWTQERKIRLKYLAAQRKAQEKG